MPLPCCNIPGLALALCAAVLACSDPPPESRSGLPLVAVTVGPHRYFVEQLSGGAVDVIALLPPGASPADFEPGIETLRALEDASLLVRVGHPHFPFERAWLDRLLRERPDLRVVDAHPHAARDDPHDPHAWLSPAAATVLVDALAPELARLIDDEPGVQTRAQELHAKIEALDSELRGTLAAVRGGRFLVLHPAWGHFARHYGLEQVAIEHEGKAPGPLELSQLLRSATRNGLHSVIVAPQIDPGRAHSVARAIDGRVVLLDPLAADWPDSMRRTARLLASEAAVP